MSTGQEHKQSWLFRLNEHLENYRYDISTSADQNEIEMFNQLSKMDLESFENVIIFFNYIITVQDIPTSRLKEQRHCVPKDMNVAGPSKPTENNSLSTINKGYIPSGSLVTIMDVNDTAEMVYVRESSVEYTEKFLGNIIKVHVAHLRAPPFCRLAKVYDMCATKFKEDDIWYRGRIIQELEPLVYLVRFVDFGIVEKVHWSSLREYNFKHGANIPYEYRHHFKLNFIPHWNTNIKRHLINVSRNFHNIYKIMYDNYGEPVILQPPNNFKSLNEELKSFLFNPVPTIALNQCKPRECLIPQTVIMTLLRSYDLPSISDIS
ncbi:hypothetical protein ACFFRR_011315 [Megaselia abdita]